VDSYQTNDTIILDLNDSIILHMDSSLYLPKFQSTELIKANIEDIGRQAWLMEHMLIMPKHEAWIRREVAVRRASATTRIEGASLDEAAVNRLLIKGPTSAPSDDELANLNAIRAYEFVDYLSDQHDIPLNELAIRELNRQFLVGIDETLTPGVYRRGQNTVGRFTPPDQGDVPGLMRAFASWLEKEDSVDPALRAGLAHIHFVAVHPFWDGNGRTARALATLILQRSSYAFKKLLSLEALIFEHRSEYFDALERTLGEGFEADYDATPWLEYFTGILRIHGSVLTDELTDWHRTMAEFQRDIAGMGLNQRHAEALAYAMRTGQLTRSDYMEITGVAPITATRDLARLVGDGWLSVEGKTRGRVYRFVPTRKDPIAQPINQRPLF
jgi:Fic family protein